MVGQRSERGLLLLPFDRRTQGDILVTVELGGIAYGGGKLAFFHTTFCALDDEGPAP